MNQPTPAIVNIAIIIPARYKSTRLPGKPLALIAGQTMIQRVWSIAQHVCGLYKAHTNIRISACVTSEDERIIHYCEQQAITCLLTSPECRSGTERVAHASLKLDPAPDFIVNLQGDNALCPPWFIDALIQRYLIYRSQPDDQRQPAVFTPYVQLDWQALDRLREIKQSTPFSGTCVVFNSEERAFWFSKNIIPAIRGEQKLRQTQTLSPVCRHIGLYGYDAAALQKIIALEETSYEALEGLEQLSFLEADIPIFMVETDYRGRQGMTGIDSAEDIERAEKIIASDGELLEQEQ